MDGNGRRAKKRLLPRTRGHKEACSRIIEVLRACKDLNIKVASLYAFSTENWNRPQDEIDKLFEYFDIPENENSEVTTVNGWVMENTDKIPEIGDSFEYDRLWATVESVDGKRADKIKIVYNNIEEEENV